MQKRKLMPREEFRLRCPYGKWTCGDGREVLYNRYYWPILERYPGGEAKAADPYEWIEDIISDMPKEGYFSDATAPWARAYQDRPWLPRPETTIAKINEVLAEWKVALLPLEFSKGAGPFIRYDKYGLGGRPVAYWELATEGKRLIITKNGSRLECIRT